jgi:hypothetical protein
MYKKRYNKLVNQIENGNEKLILPVEHFDFSKIDYGEIAKLANERLIYYIVNKQNIDIPFETMESFFRIEFLRKLKEYIK